MRASPDALLLNTVLAEEREEHAKEREKNAKEREENAKERVQLKSENSKLTVNVMELIEQTKALATKLDNLVGNLTAASPTTPSSRQKRSRVSVDGQASASVMTLVSTTGVSSSLHVSSAGAMASLQELMMETPAARRIAKLRDLDGPVWNQTVFTKELLQDVITTVVQSGLSLDQPDSYLPPTRPNQLKSRVAKTIGMLKFLVTTEEHKSQQKHWDGLRPWLLEGAPAPGSKEYTLAETKLKNDAVAACRAVMRYCEDEVRNYNAKVGEFVTSHPKYQNPPTPYNGFNNKKKVDAT